MAESTRSVVVKKFGSYDVLSVQEFNLPPLDGLIEIKVEYGGVNFADIYTRKGLMQDKKFPFVLGMECTGVIVAIGVKDTNLSVGQRVICYDYKGGMYRDVVRVTADKIYPLPNEVTMEEGATLFVNYLTAYFSVFTLGNLRKNENILILSCAGGVGSAATQLAKTVEGVKIFGTTSPGKENEAKQNGVDYVCPTGTFQNEESQSGYDLIISNESGTVFAALQEFLKPLGRIVILGANNIIEDDRKLSTFTLLKAWLFVKNVSLLSLITHNRLVGGFHLGTLIEKSPEKIVAALEEIFKLLKEKKIKPKIHAILGLDQIVEATKMLAERKNVGKVLLKMTKSE